MHRSGAILFSAPGGQDYFCYGRQGQQEIHALINQVALVESVLLMALLADRAYEGYVSEGDVVDYLLRFTDLDGARLQPGPIDRMPSLHRSGVAHKSSYTFQISAPYRSTSPQRVAALLLAEVYIWFGHEEDKIPYTALTAEGRVVSTDELKNLS